MLCTHNFQDKNSLKNHYIARHKINPTNWFFKALFEDNVDRFFVRKCYCCKQFLTSRGKEKTHNFLKHYQKGGQIPLEYKPIDIKTDNKVKKFSIEFDKHKNSYDFTDLIKLPEDFFLFG